MKVSHSFVVTVGAMVVIGVAGSLWLKQQFDLALKEARFNFKDEDTFTLTMGKNSAVFNMSTQISCVKRAVDKPWTCSNKDIGQKGQAALCVLAKQSNSEPFCSKHCIEPNPTK